MDAAQFFVPRASEALRLELPSAEFADASEFAQMLQTSRPSPSSPPRGQEDSAQRHEVTEPAANGPDCDRNCDEQATRSSENARQSTEASSTSSNEAVSPSEEPESKHSEEEPSDEQTDDDARE